MWIADRREEVQYSESGRVIYIYVCVCKFTLHFSNENFPGRSKGISLKPRYSRNHKT